MASIERTAYPRFPRTLTLKDLQASFTPKPEEIEWAQQQSRTPERRLALLVLLKFFEFLRHFPALDAIPAELVEHVSATLGMAPTEKIEFASLATLYRHHKAIRDLLGEALHRCTNTHAGHPDRPGGRQHRGDPR